MSYISRKMDGVITEAHVVINITVDACEIEPPAPPSSPCEEQYNEEEQEDDGKFVVKLETCPICHEEASTPMIVLECGHVFHEECFKEFVTYELKTTKTSIICPFCRDVILEVERPNNAQTTEQHREQRTRIQEEIQQVQVNQPLTFKQRVRNFFQSRTGRFLTSTIIESVVVATIVVIAYRSSCSHSNSNC
jgi:hypothetical protein